MTGLADIRRIRVIAWFTGCDTAIMATDTGTNHFRVIQRCDERQPVARWYTVTGITSIRGIRMTTWFTLCNRIVVAAHTTANYLTVIQWRNEW
jgi:hypothetical protein